jgi:hypothetical protein
MTLSPLSPIVRQSLA